VRILDRSNCPRNKTTKGSTTPGFDVFRGNNEVERSFLAGKVGDVGLSGGGERLQL
jgi:hypothetical protein